MSVLKVGGTVPGREARGRLLRVDIGASSEEAEEPESVRNSLHRRYRVGWKDMQTQRKKENEESGDKQTRINT